MTPRAQALGKAAALLLLLATVGSARGEEAAGPPAASSPPPGAGSAEEGGQPHEAGGPRSRQRRTRVTQEQRFQQLVSGLKLDSEQQVAVREALEAHREEVRQAMLAPSGPGATRVAKLFEINHRTAERIRAVLTEEQRKLFGQPMPIQGGGVEGRRTLEEWLDVLHKHQNQGDT